MTAPRLRRRWHELPVAVRFLVLHAAIGFALAGCAVAAILWADPGGLGVLLRRAEDHPGPLLLLWLFLGLSFAAVQGAAAVMLLGQASRPPRPPLGPPVALRLARRP